MVIRWSVVLLFHMPSHIFEFFTVNTKLDLTTAKKVTSSGDQPDARDYLLV